MKYFFYYLLSLLPILSFAAETPAEGVIFYRSDPTEPDELAKVHKFSNLEDFESLVNCTPIDGSKKLRVFSKNIIGILHYPDLTNGSIATAEEKSDFLSLVEKMEQAMVRYPASYHVISEDLRRFQSIEQLLNQGKVLLSGKWKLESEMEIKIGPVSLPELVVDGKVYRGVRLTAIDAGKAKFIHSSGIEVKRIDNLSEEVISKLNRTSKTLRIVKDSEMTASSQGGAPEEQKTLHTTKILDDFDSGTLIDLEGNRFTEVKVRSVEPNAILIFHSRGSANLSFDILPEPIKIKFGYDPVAAAAAKEAEAKKQAALRAQAMAEAAAREEEERKKEELARLLKSAEYIRFRITQVVDNGLLIWNLRDSKTELLKINPDHFDVADGEIYNAWVVSSGTYKYESVLGVGKTVRAWKFIPTE